MIDSNSDSVSCDRGRSARPVGPVESVRDAVEVLPVLPAESIRHVGPIDGPVRPLPAEVPQNQINRQPVRQSIVMSSGLLATTAVALAVLLGTVIVRQIIAFNTALSTTHPMLGTVGVAATAIIAISVGGIILRSMARYRQLQRIVELQELHARVTGVSTGSFSRHATAALDRLGRLQIVAYTQRLEQLGNTEICAAVHELKLRYAAYGNDLLQDFEWLEEYILKKADASANRIARRIAQEVAIGTAVAPRFLDVPIMIWRSFVLVEQIAHIYAGRPGTLGTLRLLRRGLGMVLISGVMESVSTSLLESGLETIFQKLARRASEGIVNGALILRLAEAVKQQCRPVPPKPASASELLSVVRDLFLRRPESAVVPN